MIAFCVVLAGLGTAELIRRILKRKSTGILQATAFGLGALSMIIMAFGALGLYAGVGRIALLALCGLITLVGAYAAIVYLKDWFAQRKTQGKINCTNLTIALLLVVIALVALVAADAPPAMDDWDSLAYHLTAPRLYIEHGGLYYIDYFSHSNFPMLVEMLYIPGLMLGSTSGAKLVHFFFGILFAASVFRLTVRHLHPRAGWLATLAVAGIPIILWESTTAYIDLASALYTVLAAHALLDLTDHDRPVFALIAGLAAGFAASTKLLGLSVILLGLAWLVAVQLAKKRAGTLKIIMLFIAGATVCLPWYLRSFVYTGSPVYPFFYSVFGGKNWSVELANAYSVSQQKFGMGHGLLDLIKLPYNLALHPERFYDTAGLIVGPILLIGLPALLLMIKHRNMKLVGLAGFTLAQLLLWFALTQQSRYLFPVYGLLAALVAALIYMQPLRVLKTGYWVIFLATAAVGIYTLVPLAASRYAVATGRESADEYLSRNLDSYRATSYINDNLPSNARVALFGDTRGYYLHRDFIWADWGHNTRFSKDFLSEKELVDYLIAQNIGYVLMNMNFLPKEHNGPLILEAAQTGLIAQEYPDYYSRSKVLVYRVIQ